MLDAIAKRLLTEGRKIFEARDPLIDFTGNPDCDALVSNLEEYPHAFVIACLMDSQMTGKRAWRVPYCFSERLGTFRFSALVALPLDEYRRHMEGPTALHRYPSQRAEVFFEAVQHIKSEYGGDASQIWRGTPSSAMVVCRFLRFKGAGPKIATMAANILARELKVRFSDYCSIDVSVDRQVRRVLKRLELVPKDAKNEEIIYRARAICPEFPGLIDLPCWKIGNQWCHDSRPDCGACYMHEMCPSRAAAPAN